MKQQRLSDGSKRRVRANPRRRDDIGKPWDVDVPLEYLPPEVRRVCVQALEAGQYAWAGALSPQRPGHSAHLIAPGRLKDAARDALAEAGFQKGWLVPGHYYWSANGEPLRRKGLAHETDARALARALAERDRRLGVQAALVCARWALRYVPAGEQRPLRALETTEAWLRGEATPEEVRRVADAAYSPDAYATASYAASYAVSAAVSAAAYAAAWSTAADAAAWATADAAAADATVATPKEYERVRTVVLAELCDVIRFRVEVP